MNDDLKEKIAVVLIVIFCAVSIPISCAQIAALESKIATGGTSK